MWSWTLYILTHWQRKIRWNHYIFTLILFLVLFSLSIKMIAAIEKTNTTEKVYLVILELLYWNTVLFTIFNSTNPHQLLNILLIELNRETIFSQEKTSGETQGLLLTCKNFLTWIKFYSFVKLPTRHPH